MSSSVRVAVVTGSNKGVGFGIVRGLCKQFSGDVYITARDVDRGKAAVVELEKEGLHPKFHQLDIDDLDSIAKFKKFLQDTYGGLDILINNAGIAYKGNSTAPFTEQAEVTLRTNYWGTLHVSEALFPLLRPHARVVHVSSIVSTMSLKKCSEELRNELKAVKSIDAISKFMTKFVDDVKAGKHEASGWPNTAYGVSKIGVTLLAKVHQELFDADTTREDIIVNAVCPGYVNTDMTSHQGVKTIDEGADTPIYAALIPSGATGPKGKFISDRKVSEY